ncbi:STAS/SEC14 domain-containing protein [Fulvimarina sp. MAC3]|uniref:STAS/SEC14 domain-containing protein n=1 Tax=Fulvimarina sp. MAC3 TaxID=3148887 RepID=UPI0031FDA252
MLTRMYAPANIVAVRLVGTTTANDMESVSKLFDTAFQHYDVVGVVVDISRFQGASFQALLIEDSLRQKLEMKSLSIGRVAFIVDEDDTQKLDALRDFATAESSVRVFFSDQEFYAVDWTTGPSEEHHAANDLTEHRLVFDFLFKPDRFPVEISSFVQD